MSLLYGDWKSQISFNIFRKALTQSPLFAFSKKFVELATLTKEVYVMYMVVKKLKFYLEDADITLCSDYLPLKKFLHKKTLIAKL